MNTLRRFILAFLPLALAAGSLFGQSAEQKIDSVQLSYFRWCNAHSSDPQVMAKADTLFALAGKDNNRRMQAVALCLKARHYSVVDNLDSLQYWVDYTKQFTKQYDQPTHYFGVWQQLINYYSTHSHYIMAQKEVQKMLEEAKVSDYKPAMVDAYRSLGKIFSTRNQSNQSFYAFKKAADYIEENQLDYPTADFIYLQLAHRYMREFDDFKSAREYLRKAEKGIQLPEYIWGIRYEEACLLFYEGKYAEAEKMLAAVEQHETRFNPSRLELRARIHIKQHRYNEAMVCIDRLIRYHTNDGQSDPTKSLDSYMYATILGLRAETRAYQGRYREAYEDQVQVTNIESRRWQNDNNNAFEEITTMLDVARLDREKVEAEQQAQQERLRRSRSLAVSMGVIILLLIAFLAYVMHTNRRLARAKRATEESNRMKTLFIRNITHEINTPLNAILGFSEMAAEPDIEVDERTTCIETVRENGDRLQKLVDNVLHIADLEASERTPETDSTDLVQLCHRAMDTVTIKTKHPLDIHIHPDGKPLPARASGMLITKALTEMLYNAAYFAPDKPITLDVALDESAHTATFTVTDRGKGIPAAEAEHIFERFFKLDTFTDGLGLGLSVCRLIADTLGGEIHLDTTYTEGARFVFTVPIK